MEIIKSPRLLVFLSLLKIKGILAVEPGPGGLIGTGSGAEITNPLKADSIVGVLKAISDFLIVIGAPLLVILVIIGGFQILTAAGNPEKINTGKKTILYASIGYAIVLSAWGIIAIIKQTLGVK